MQYIDTYYKKVNQLADYVTATMDPKMKWMWGRGNGWVICGFPMILDSIGTDHKEAPVIIELLQKTSESLRLFR